MRALCWPLGRPVQANQKTYGVHVKKLILAVGVAALVLAACGKKEEAAEPAPAAAPTTTAPAPSEPAPAATTMTPPVSTTTTTIAPTPEQ